MTKNIPNLLLPDELAVVCSGDLFIESILRGFCSQNDRNGMHIYLCLPIEYTEFNMGEIWRDSHFYVF